MREAKKKWRCFHCDFVTTSPKYAAEHFGLQEFDSDPQGGSR